MSKPLDRLLAIRADLDARLANTDPSEPLLVCPTCYGERRSARPLEACLNCGRVSDSLRLAEALVALQDMIRFAQSEGAERDARSPVVLDTAADYHTSRQWHLCSSCNWTWLCGDRHAHGHPGCVERAAS